MILLAIDLKGQHTFGEIVSTRFTSMDVYVRCRSIKTNLGENDGIHFQAQCASTVHRSSAALQFSCRLGTVGILLLVNQANHKGLQGAYRDTTQLSQSNTMMNLAYISSVCRSYEHELETGGAKAKLGYSDLNPTVPSVVTILDKDGQTLTLTRQQLVRGHGKLLGKFADHIEEVVDIMLDHPPSAELCNELVSLQHLPFVGPGTSRTDAKLILMESLLSAKPNVHGSHHRNSDLVYAHPNGGNELRVHMFSAVFPIRVVGSSDTRGIHSAHMRRWIGVMAQQDPRVAVQLCEANNAMVDLLCTLFTFPFRGIARPHEIFRTLIGSTNALTSNQTKPNVFPDFSVGDEAVNRIRVDFRPTKNCSVLGSQSLLPEEVGRAFVLFDTLVRGGLLDWIERSHPKVCINGGKAFAISDTSSQSEIRQELVVAALQLCVDIEPNMDPNDSIESISIRVAPKMHDRVTDCLNETLDTDNGQVTLPMWRQIHCALASAICSAAPSSTDPTVAKGSNHTVQTHDRQYSESVETPHGKIPRQQIEAADRQDTQKAEWLACSGWGCIAGNVTSTVDGTIVSSNPWDDKAIRILSNAEAWSFIRLCFGVDADFRQHQVTLLQEAISTGDRDSHNVYGCGSGKTVTTFALPLYGFLQQVAKESELEKKAFLLRQRLQLKEKSDFFIQQFIEDVLTKEEFKRILDYAKHDSHLVPVGNVVVVMIPFSVAADGLVKEINRCNLVKAVRWEHTSSDFIRQELYEAGRAAMNPVRSQWDTAFQVVVATVPFLAARENKIILERAIQQRVVQVVVLDEAHAVLQIPHSQTPLTELSTLRRSGAKFFTLTGSCPVVLARELCCAVGSKAGRPAHHTKTLPVVALEARKNDLDGLVKQYHHCQGMNRAQSTVPSHVFHCVITDEQMDSRTTNFANGALTFVQQLRSETHASIDQIQDVLILLPTRDMVELFCRSATTIFQSEDFVALVGGEGSDKATEFNDTWTGGTAFLAIATSAAACSINNTKCNCVITVEWYFDVNLLVQGSNRAGRAQQQSYHIAFHKPASLNRQLRSGGLSEANSKAVKQAMGVNMDNPAVCRALSPGSIIGFMSGKCCRRNALRKEMDGIVHDPSQVQERNRNCCDVCSPSMQAVFNGFWNHAKRLVEQRQAADTTDEDERSFWDAVARDLPDENRDPNVQVGPTRAEQEAAEKEDDENDQKIERERHERAQVGTTLTKNCARCRWHIQGTIDTDQAKFPKGDCLKDLKPFLYGSLGQLPNQFCFKCGRM